MPLNTLQYTEELRQQRISWPKASVVARLRSRALEPQVRWQLLVDHSLEELFSLM